ncbi:MAG: protoporphyrin/coproporphyrin ferrochelatase [Pyrinomonadaceae bacterium]|jgi:ferrochelatase|nr:protoporphyrin/coproporphyrin ferrochelatase [Pyrinomonadaceae bacterium]
MTGNYDALLVISFGGPEGRDDVMPFLENVLRGRNVPRERMLDVAKHYELFAGVSPINGQNRKLIAALEELLETKGPRLPIYFGNRNWHPLLADTLAKMRDDGVRQALGFVTSAYSSYSSCRQYLEDLERARAAVGPDAPQVEKLRPFYNHPGFIEANIANVRVALEEIPEARRAETQLAFTAHSIPLSMAENCDYEAQLRETGRLVAAGVGNTNWQLVFQSRSGSPRQPWLEPDICDHVRELKAHGARDLVIAPIGFVSDHMEIIYDLDTEARALCQELGVNPVRAATAGTHPAFIAMVRELILERIDPATPRGAIGRAGPRADTCRPGCCSPS